MKNCPVPNSSFDIVIVGGGVVGLATALQLSRRFPSARCVVLEKEDGLGRHQTGHNNCVIHTGIYYRTGSLKARNCVRGARLLKAFCDENGVEYEDCGKVIVATNPQEVPALEELYRRGVANGVSGLELIGPERLREIEPHASGVKAIHSPETAIVDYNAVTDAYAQLFRESGGEVWTGARVRGIRSRPEGLELDTERGTVSTRYLVNCAGLHADHIAAMAGVKTNVRLIPFRGEFYALKPAAKGFVRNLIYPVPDPRFPFLGATFGRIKGGVIRSGPNAMVAGSREGYSITDLDPKEAWTILSMPAFWRMAVRYWRTGLQEIYFSLSKKAYVKSMQKLVPSVGVGDLEKWGSGVRAQAILPDGTLVDDFVIKETRNAVHVINAPSPGATSSLSIGEYVTDRAASVFDLPTA